MAIITTSISGPTKGIPHRLRAGVVIKTPQRAETDGEYYERNLGFFEHEADIPHNCPNCNHTLRLAITRRSPGTIINKTYHCVSCKRVYVAGHRIKKVNAYGN